MMKEADSNPKKKKSKKRKLTKEELLAGKTSPDSDMDKGPQGDPRFHSPDDILKDAAQRLKKANITGINNLNMSNFTNKKEDDLRQDDIMDFQAPADQASPPSKVDQTLHDFKIQHEKEIARWKEYEHQITEWKDSVLAVVRQLKDDLQKATEQVQETDRLRDFIKAQEEEIAHLKALLKKKKH